MSIIVSDSIVERGKQDAKRHREKQRESVKKQLPEIISEESIITRNTKGRVLKIPIKEIQIPVFRHGSGKKGDGDGGGGVGQGKRKSGDVLGRRPGKGSRPGQPGNEPGVDYIETEVELEEIIEMMLEDLGLPRLQEKNIREIIVELGYKFRGTQHTGPNVLLNKKLTAKEGMRRFFNVLQALVKETGKSELECFRALKEAGGIYIEALKLLAENTVTRTDEEMVPFPILEAEDQRYYRVQRKTALHSRAVVFALMDVSASMDTEKKYFARSMLFWIVEFLRKLYEHVEVRFITHHVEARLVDESEFFSSGETGGTVCASAYALTNSLIETEYPMSQWNAYVWHSSDGDDWNPERSMREVAKLFEKGINMFGYCDIRPGAEADTVSGLLKSFDEAFNLRVTKEGGGITVHESTDEARPFLGVKLCEKEHLLPAIKAFLKQDRWVEE